MITTMMTRSKIGEAIFTANALLDKDGAFIKHYTKAGFIRFIPDMAEGDFLKFMLLLNTWIQAHDVQVKLWRPWAWRFSAAIAMTKGKHIHLNRYKLNRSVSSIVGSIIHELAHIVDGKFEAQRYWHGNNYRYGEDFPQGKRRTTPYLLGELARDYVENGKLYSVEQLQAWPQSWP